MTVIGDCVAFCIIFHRDKVQDEEAIHITPPHNTAFLAIFTILCKIYAVIFIIQFVVQKTSNSSVL